MNLRDKLKHYLTISNFIESENTYTDDAILQDAIDSQLKSLKLYGKSALLPKDYLSSVTAYGKIEQRNIPAEYTEMEYLQSDGTAYIDLDCILDQNDEIEIDFMKTSNVTSCNVFGGRDSASSNNMSVIIASSGSVAADFNNSDYAPYRVIATISQNVMYKVIVNKTGRYVYDASGTLVDSNTTTCADTISTPGCYLFHLAGAGLAGKFTGVIYKCIVKGKRDCVPAYNGTEYGMYDKISGRFFGNANTVGTFTAGPEVVPTPSNPINLCCNNGVITPEAPGYKTLDYLEGDGSSYILTNLRIANTDVIETTFQNNSASAVGAIYGEYVRNNASALYSNGTYYGYDSALNKIDTGVSIDTNWHNSVHDFINGTITIDDTTVTFTPYTFTNDIDNALFARYYNNSYGYCYNGKIKKFKVTRNGTVISNLIPVMRASDSVLGMYDTITGDFWTGTGTFTYGSIVDTNIKVSGIKEKVTDSLAQINQFNKNHYTEITAYVNANTGVITVGTTQKCAVIPCKPNTTYKITGRTSSAWGSFTSYAIGSTATTYVRTDNVLTTGPNDIYLAGLVRTTDDTYNYLDTLTIVDLSSGTAICEMLCGVGDYKDSQEVFSGNIIRNIGIKVLDGTENWNYNNIRFSMILSGAPESNNNIAVCSHYKNVIGTTPVADMSNQTFKLNNLNRQLIFKDSSFTTLSAWTTFLADQYAAGTPVIVVYPLATSTTESTTPQTNLKLAPVSVLEASIDNLELSYTTTAVSTPTPEKPLDIGCNNGIIDDKYEQLEYLESTGTQYIDTGIVPTNTFGFEVDIAPKNVTTDSAKIGVRDNSSTASRCWWGASSNAAYLGWNSIINQNQATPVAIGTFYNIKVNYLNDRNYMFNGEQINAAPLETLNTFSNTSTFILFGTSVAGTVTTNNSKDSKISRATFTNNDEIIMDLIPARRKSDNVLGMLDLVSGNFLTNNGTGTFTAGNVAGTIANGNREVIKVGSKNLFNDTPYKIGYYIDANGNEVEATQYQEEYLIRQARVQPSTKYMISWKGVVGGYTQRIHAYDATGNWLSQIAAISDIIPGAVKYTSITTPANCAYIRQGGRSQTEYQLEESGRPTEYHNYITISYKNPVSLLGVDDYKDSYDMINGDIIRNVGIKILDGTEMWTQTTTNVVEANIMTGQQYGEIAICSHLIYSSAGNFGAMPDNSFKTGTTTYQTKIYCKSSIYATDVTTWKQFLAEQYAIGTPVIVIYPLATPTTSITSNENIDVTCGSPSISRESDYINNLTMDINYLKLK